MGMTEEQLAAIREASDNSFPFIQRTGEIGRAHV